MADETPPLDDARLEMIRRLIDVATPGPWEISADSQRIVSTHADAEKWPGLGLIYKRAPYQLGVDMEFIAASRSIVPDLLAEVDRLHAENALLTDENNRLEAHIHVLGERAADMAERLRAAQQIVHDVAVLPPVVAWGREYREICGACGGHRMLDEFGAPIDDASIQHQPGCVIARAANISPNTPAE